VGRNRRAEGDQEHWFATHIPLAQSAFPLQPSPAAQPPLVPGPSQSRLQLPQFLLLWSSHISVSGQTIPSPHIEPVPGPVQVALQVPHGVVWLSSHASEPTVIPSPHTGLHALGIAELHVQPSSTLHVAEQPSSSLGGV
jgi:hypothetical protein